MSNTHRHRERLPSLWLFWGIVMLPGFWASTFQTSGWAQQQRKVSTAGWSHAWHATGSGWSLVFLNLDTFNVITLPWWRAASLPIAWQWIWLHDMGGWTTVPASRSPRSHLEGAHGKNECGSTTSRKTWLHPWSGTPTCQQGVDAKRWPVKWIWYFLGSLAGVRTTMTLVVFLTRYGPQKDVHVQRLHLIRDQTST